MSDPILSFQKATLRLGKRTLWKDLDLDINPGEFVAILGPNGTGKTSLLKVLLGLNELADGSVTISGEPPRRGNSRIGYIPQQKSFDKDLPIRARDLVHFGLDGHKFGLERHKKSDLHRVNEVIKEVGASKYADSPIGLLSGGEQQRLRIAQALLGKPSILLCDEPLLSLDLASQQAVCELIDTYRKRDDTAVLFVTHDINPVLQIVDKVLYLVGGKWVVGTPDEVLTTECLSELYGVPVDVVRVRGRVIVVTGDENEVHHGSHHSMEAKR